MKNCIKCDKLIPSIVLIDGKRIRTKNRTSCFDCVPHIPLFKKAVKNIYNCNTCGKKVERRIKEVSHTGCVFCSSSCAAKLNNKKYKKRFFTRKCQAGCGEYISSSKNYCKICFEKIKQSFDFSDKTLAEYALKRSGANKFAAIRQQARKIYNKSGKPKCCFICNYSTVIEICHKKSISSFPMTTLIKEINDIKNLVALCPNHHKEFDKNLIKI